jgi:hypothetical protein
MSLRGIIGGVKISSYGPVDDAEHDLAGGTGFRAILSDGRSLVPSFRNAKDALGHGP